MPLESLRQPFDPEQAGHKLREVQAEQEARPEYTKEAAQERFNNAADSLFLHDMGVWFETSNQDMNFFITNTQLWAANAGLQFDPASAQKYFGELRHSRFYNEDTGEWTSGVKPKKPEEVLGGQSVEAAVLSALFENQARGADAKKMYEKISDDYFNRWWHYDKEQKNPMILTSRQLLPVILISRFHPEGARNRFEALKNSNLYNEEENVWVYMDAGKDSPLRLGVSAEVELLAVLTEAQWNPEAARQRYEQLKESPLYDSRRDLWVDSYDLRTSEVVSTFETKEQMMAVWIECELAKHAAKPLSKPTKLPEERNF